MTYQKELNTNLTTIWFEHVFCRSRIKKQIWKKKKTQNKRRNKHKSVVPSQMNEKRYRANDQCGDDDVVWDNNVEKIG